MTSSPRTPEYSPVPPVMTPTDALGVGIDVEDQRSRKGDDVFAIVRILKGSRQSIQIPDVRCEL